MKILLAEDDPNSRRIVKVFLSAAGYEIAEAEDGQAAWELFQREPFHMVITDWMMPRLDGMELIRNIRSGGRQNYTYIIMLTAIDDKQKVVAGLESGADEYLTKPFDRDELIARVASGVRIIKLEEQLTQAHHQMEILAMQDGLTGLLNRRAVEQHARAELELTRRTQRPLSVILLDIDQFKLVNDQYGHAVGDQVLRHLAGILTSNLREYDRVGRWGGEEFIAILPDTDLSEGVAVAERLRSAVAASKIAIGNDEPCMIHISLGVACASGSSPSLTHLVEAADEALYRAKKTGRNRVCSVDQRVE